MSATSLLFRGQHERRAGRPEAALHRLERAAELAPDSPHVALHRALALADSGRLDAAFEALESAGTRWAENPVFPLFHAVLLIEAERLDEAEARVAEARTRSPRNMLVEACSALVAMRRGAIEAPLRRLGAVGFTDNPRVLASILTEVEAELFRRFGADTDPPPPPPDVVPEPNERMRRGNAKRLAARGLSRLEKGNAPGAWPLLVVAAQKNPSLRDVFAYLGFAAFDLGRYDEALGYLGRVIEGSAVRESVLLHRGACLYRLGRHAEALASLEAALEADVLGNYTAWIHLFTGRTLVALDRTPEARPHFRAALEVEGDLGMARLERARELLGLAVADGSPRGFDVLDDGPTTLIVRPAYAEAVRERRPATTAGPPKYGRAPLERVALPDGVALVRHCHRGGLLARILGDRYLDGGRFVREAAAAEALRQRGVPTPEIIAIVQHRAFPGVYRADVITREVPDSRDLAEALATLPPGEDGVARKRALMEATALLLRRMHDAGLRHADLNARNLLITADGTAMILDLDRAELADELPQRDRAAAFARLYRSLHKLGLAPEPVSDDDCAAFYDTYAGDDPVLRGHAAEVLAMCHRDLWLHRLGWRKVAPPTAPENTEGRASDVH